MFNIKTVLFQTIQFNRSTQFSSIWLIDRTLLGAIIPVQNGPRSDGNKRGTPYFPKLQHYWNLTIRSFNFIFWTLIGEVGVLPLCRKAVGLFYSQLGKAMEEYSCLDWGFGKYIYETYYLFGKMWRLWVLLGWYT